VDRQDLQALAKIRLAEAKALLGSGHYDGAYYLAGYAVECALKACIAKSNQRHEFPDKGKVLASYSHDLPALVKVAGLDDAHRERIGQDSNFQLNWEVVRLWSEQSRYRRHGQEIAEALLAAVGERRHGVITWIKLHW
jgi:HEPN domain-containing protein